MAFEDSGHHPQWPKVADVVIEAQLKGETMTTSIVERRIDEWKQKLIDPSRRNGLIYFRPSKSSTLTISTPEAETVFNRLVVQEKSWKFWFPPAEQDKKDNTQDNLFAHEPLGNTSPCLAQKRAQTG